MRAHESQLQNQDCRARPGGGGSLGSFDGELTLEMIHEESRKALPPSKARGPEHEAPGRRGPRGADTRSSGSRLKTKSASGKETEAARRHRNESIAQAGAADGRSGEAAGGASVLGAACRGAGRCGRGGLQSPGPGSVLHGCHSGFLSAVPAPRQHPGEPSPPGGTPLLSLCPTFSGQGHCIV